MAEAMPSIQSRATEGSETDHVVCFQIRPKLAQPLHPPKVTGLEHKGIAAAPGEAWLIVIDWD